MTMWLTGVGGRVYDVGDDNLGGAPMITRIAFGEDDHVLRAWNDTGDSWARGGTAEEALQLAVALRLHYLDSVDRQAHMHIWVF